MYVEVVCPQEVIRGKLAKMDLVEAAPRLSAQAHKEKEVDVHDLVRVAEFVQAQRERQRRQHSYNDDTSLLCFKNSFYRMTIVLSFRSGKVPSRTRGHTGF